MAGFKRGTGGKTYISIYNRGSGFRALVAVAPRPKERALDIPGFSPSRCTPQLGGPSSFQGLALPPWGVSWGHAWETFDLSLAMLGKHAFTLDFLPHKLWRSGYLTQNLFQVLGTKYLVPSTGTKYLVPSVWYQVLGAKHLVPRTWYQVLGTKYLVPST